MFVVFGRGICLILSTTLVFNILLLLDETEWPFDKNTDGLKQLHFT